MKALLSCRRQPNSGVAVAVGRCGITDRGAEIVTTGGSPTGVMKMGVTMKGVMMMGCGTTIV